MSRRLKITLPDPVCQHLTELAQETGESLAGVTVRIVLSKIEDGGAKRRGRSLVRSAYRERCLHPGHARSDGSTTAAVRRLCERYPETLSNLTEEWRANESQLETLLALAAWRSAIDEQGGDPREELEFHSSLFTCSQSLGGDVHRGVTRPTSAPGD